MKFRVILFGLLFFAFFSCGTKKQLQREFKGKPVALLKETFGEPKTVLEQENGTVYVFEKLKELESTEISQGKLTLDEIVTPKVNKTERYYFTVKDGIIVETRYEEEYER
ncbi:hypothetical protein GM418_03420 [Maribellus comscasis]|uniref:Lipoprotein n=1 Tax=Maribellus comscasis TaxID=2681766 RepID=A0A6I6JYJ9_9BACT|nr:hypothetical protein [Maribellus comscasis]QGY42734.1 hypothetical protein GM418_03420 [Maribellus comscasis]